VKLYRAEATVVTFLLAADFESARDEAPECLEDEFTDTPPEIVRIGEILHPGWVDTGWIDAIPRGDNPEGVTCRGFLDALEAAAAARRAAALAPGQPGLPGIKTAETTRATVHHPVIHASED
jgi:hypothetical protein